MSANAGDAHLAAMSRSNALRHARDRLRRAGIEAAEDEARMLLAVAGIDRMALIRDPDMALGDAAATALSRALGLRIGGMPPGRIAGRKAFFGLDLALNADTLEPRADTEILVQAILPHLDRMVCRQGKARVLDIGTGSGAIGLAIVSALAGVDVVATDIARGAVASANANARRLGVASRFRAVRRDLLPAACPAAGFDAILSNPPYIARGVIAGLSTEVRRHDPVRALDGGVDGLAFYRRVAAAAIEVLAPCGVIGLEIGHDQAAAVSAMFAALGWRRIARVRDLGGRDRVLVFRRRRW